MRSATVVFRWVNSEGKSEVVRGGPKLGRSDDAEDTALSSVRSSLEPAATVASATTAMTSIAACPRVFSFSFSTLISATIQAKPVQTALSSELSSPHNSL